MSGEAFICAVIVISLSVVAFCEYREIRKLRKEIRERQINDETDGEW